VCVWPQAPPAPPRTLPCVPSAPAHLAGLRDRAAQRTLSELAALPNVHLAASCDHANAALLWDQQVRLGGGGGGGWGAGLVGGRKPAAASMQPLHLLGSMAGWLVQAAAHGAPSHGWGAVGRASSPPTPPPLLPTNPRGTPPPTCPHPPQTRDRFSWVWHNATNYAPYLREVAFAGEAWGPGEGPGEGTVLVLHVCTSVV
jgi:hypothetical protein